LRAGRPRQALELRAELLEPRAEPRGLDLEEERLLGLEVAVERRLRQARGLGDVAHGELGPGSRLEELPGVVEDVLPPLLLVFRAPGAPGSRHSSHRASRATSRFIRAP